MQILCGLVGTKICQFLEKWAIPIPPFHLFENRISRSIGQSIQIHFSVKYYRPTREMSFGWIMIYGIRCLSQTNEKAKK